MTKHEFKWAPDLPHMEVRTFITERLRTDPPSEALDATVCGLLGTRLTACTQHLGSAISLIPDGWWWHLSHLEARITPTKPVDGAPISNGTLYDWYGSPVGFTAMCFERRDLPVALCEALLKARYDLPDAFVVQASASEQNNFHSRMQRYRHERQHPPKTTLWHRAARAFDILLDRQDD